MDLISELTNAFPASSLPPLIAQVQADLLQGMRALCDSTVELDGTVTRLVEERWKGVRQTFAERPSPYEGMEEEALILAVSRDVLCDDYQPSRKNNTDLLLDGLTLHSLLMRCQLEDAPLPPLELVVRVLASTGKLLKELMRALTITREMVAGGGAALKACDRHAATRQATVDAFYRVSNRATKAPREIVREVHEMTGTGLNTIRRHLTREGLLTFKGYE